MKEPTHRLKRPRHRSSFLQNAATAGLVNRHRTEEARRLQIGKDFKLRGRR